MRKSTLDHTDAVGPMDEFEPSGMSPLELNSVELSRTETCGSRSICSEVDEERKLSFKQRVRKASSKTWKELIRFVDPRY